MSIKQRFSALSLALALVLASLQVVQVAADDQVICSDRPPILPRYGDYSHHCENQSEWPCFSMVEGSLDGAVILKGYKGDQSVEDGLLLVKNGDLKDFTLKTTDEVFEIRYQYAGVSLYYSPQPGKCYVLAARKWDPKLGYQLYVTFQPDGRDRALGTETSSEGSDFACEKRAYIHVSKVDGA